MSSFPQPSAPLLPTRQQLDELEALMQRMLALPLQDEDPPQSQPAASSSRDSEALLVEQLATEAIIRPPVVVERRPAVEPQQPRASRPLRPLNLPPALAVPPQAGVKPVQEPQPATSSAPPPLPLWLRPLGWINDLFDAATLVLGPFGRWLRSDTGRLGLGLLGLVLLAAAIAWVVLEQTGWTWSPPPLR